MKLKYVNALGLNYDLYPVIWETLVSEVLEYST